MKVASARQPHVGHRVQLFQMPGDEHCLTEYNVCIRSSLGGGSSPMRCNTFTSLARRHMHRPIPGRTWIWARPKDDPGFAEPAWMDYRLQSDSPRRGKGKDGTDLGACARKGWAATRRQITFPLGSFCGSPDS